ncbi:AbrB family transcriptional regulator [Aurantimonas sp. A3-2-R12]|uniref:AbrB family transcriptional regulator n=1 Tax=Aurantimonas sp. A3-2-R12 TaxID=3114362 RepID=UPI002E19A36F|nr:AbrB family transcriptional regulator [Aurantimonas sp. A3-2-R12]
MSAIRDRLAKALEPLAPKRFAYARFALALGIGLIGAFVFLRLSLPLPWMLGPLAACLLASLLRMPVTAPTILRPPMTMLVGVLLGAGFTPGMVTGIADWLPSLLGLMVFLFVAAAACVTYFYRVAGFDLPTAYFAGMPGGLIEMVTLGQAKGGDPRIIALIHSSRIMLIVFSLPFVLDVVTGEQVITRPTTGLSIFDAPWTVEAWLVVTGLVGIVLGRILRLPAPYLMGPMLASGAVHLTGITEFRPPYELVAAAQLVLGTALGCRFAGTRLTELARILGLALGSTAILLSITLGFSLGLNRLIGLPVLDLLLAYSPGGLTETSLIALALHVEVAFVATHHVTRVFLVMTTAGLVFRLVDKFRGPS